MNKTLLPLFICFLVLNASLLQAQEFQVGLKGGINKTFGGEITGMTPSVYARETFKAEGEIGFHGGIWTQINFGKFFIRPEIVYSKPESRFDFPQGPAFYDVEEFSVPVLVGYNVYGPVDIFAGLAYKNIMDAVLVGNGDGGFPSTPIVDQNTSLSAQLGAKIEFGNFGLDFRYDFYRYSQQYQILNFVPGSTPSLDSAVFYDARLNQLIISLTVKLWSAKMWVKAEEVAVVADL